MNTAVATPEAPRRRGRKQKNPWRGRIVQAVIAIVVIGLLGWVVKSILTGEKPKKAVPDVVQLKLLTPPPPPPPPPPPKAEPVKQETPQQTPQPTPQTPTPKVESPPQLAADSSGPGDLAGKVGGTEYTGNSTAIGAGGDTGGGNYAGVIVNDLRKAMLADERLRLQMRKKARVSVQLTADGRIEKVTVLEGDKPDIDRLLERRLAAVGRISSPPPDGKGGVYELDISPVRY